MLGWCRSLLLGLCLTAIGICVRWHIALAYLAYRYNQKVVPHDNLLVNDAIGTVSNRL